MKSQKLELTWLGKNNDKKIEPRILIEDENNSYGKRDTENILIHGDNLLALKALEDKFTNKIKCIYIDPPYNANATDVPFDDNIEHSFYLNLMKRRIEVLFKLLAENGIFCMQCDYNEMAYLKVMCDEIFGRANYVTMITVKTSSESGVKVNANKPAKVSEYILMYCKNKDLVKYKTIHVVTGYDKNYSTYVVNPEENYENWVFKNIKDVLAEQLNKDKKYLTENELRTFQIENADRIFSVRDISDSLKKYIKDNNIDRDKIYEYITSTGKRTLLLKNGEVVFVKNKVHEIDGKKELTKIASDIWLDIAWDGIANEGGVKLKNSKKPEKLIQRILEAYTEEGDWVLDSFLGSGTTCAVAHKMNRKWIGIELGEHCYTQCIPRLKNVIDGKDFTGITKNVNWKGGGGFKFYELAPSLLVKDKFNNWIISENYNGELLSKAICKQEKFDYIEKTESYWKQGKSSENDYIFVTTNYISIEYLDAIHEEMRDYESLLICCKIYQEECEDRYNNITLKKIPQTILNNCEYGKDDYSLNVNEVLEIDEDE